MNELSYLFMILSNLADAKEKADLVALADSIADLQMVAMHSDQARIRRRATSELERANDLLVEMQVQRFGFTGQTSVLTETAEPANLN